MERPWLSVIVPSHNGERWLAAALQSVVDQKDGGIEVIVIDGSASDASLEIVDSFFKAPVTAAVAGWRFNTLSASLRSSRRWPRVALERSGQRF